MSTDQRKAAIQAALAAIEVSIAQTEAALRLATTLDDIARLNRDLVTLKAKRTQLQFELINLEAAPRAAGRAAAGASAPARPKLTAAQRKKTTAARKRFEKAVRDRRMIEAALAQNKDVLGDVAGLTATLAGGSDPTKDD